MHKLLIIFFFGLLLMVTFTSHSFNGSSLTKRQITGDNLDKLAGEVDKDTQNSLTLAEAQQKLNYIDSLRGYDKQGFSFHLTNVSYKQDKRQTVNRLMVKVMDEQSLVEYVSPKRQKRRKILKQGNNMWMHIPGTRNILRITPAQRLIGQASNGDVTGTTFSSDYDVMSITLEKHQGNAQGKDEGKDQKEVIKLELTAKRKNTAYQKIIFYLDVETQLPISSDFYSRSNRLLKRAEYREFKKYENQLKIHKILLTDPINQGSYTWMKFDQYRKHDINPALFHKDSLLR